MSYLGFTLFFYLLACIISSLAYAISRWLNPNDATANLLGFSAGTGNTGYFGLALAISLLSNEGIAVAVFSIFGFTLYEFTYGYYLVSRSHFKAKESLKKIIKLPLVYAFLLAIFLKLYHLTLPITVAGRVSEF